MVVKNVSKTLYGVPGALILFGRQLRALREGKGISQEKLAELCDFHPNQISRIERAKRTVSFEGLMRLSYGLSLAPAEFFKLIPAAKRLPKKGDFSEKSGSKRGKP